MVTRVILQTSDSIGKVDILTKEPGCPADHYLTVLDHEVDEFVEQAKESFHGETEVQDLRAGR